MTKLERRVKALEEELAKLKATPPMEYHYHHHYHQRPHEYYQPVWVSPSIFPQPWGVPTWTCGAGGAVSGSHTFIGAGAGTPTLQS